MKKGFITAILEEYTFEELVDFAREEGFSCLEVACWPSGKAERRYAGVSHIDVDKVIADENYRAFILKCTIEKNISIGALAYYPNYMDSDLSKREHNITHLKKVLLSAKLLGVDTVTTFVGRDQTKTIEENLVLFEKIWLPIVRYAEELKVKIAIENCPMLFGKDQWPGGQNLMTSPSIWEKVFSIVDSDYFGLCFDPSHFVWQNMDYIAPIYDYKDKLFHIHLKDIKLYQDRLNKVGVLAYPLEYMSPKIPGLGDVDWGKFLSALTDIGYNGNACLEIEDKAFEENLHSKCQALKQANKYIAQFLP